MFGSVTQHRRISEWMALGRLIKGLVATSKTSHFPRQSWQVDIRAKNICLFESPRQCPGNKAAFSCSKNSIFQLPNYPTPILTIRNSAGARAKVGNVVRRMSFPGNDEQSHNSRSHLRERGKKKSYNFQKKLVFEGAKFLHQPENTLKGFHPIFERIFPVKFECSDVKCFLHNPQILIFTTQKLRILLDWKKGKRK